MQLPIKEFKIWFIISFICFFVAFVERAGRPLMFFGIIFLVIGVVSMLEHEWKESQEHQEAEKRNQRRRTDELAKKIQKHNSDRKNKNRR